MKLHEIDLTKAKALHDEAQSLIATRSAPEKVRAALDLLGFLIEELQRLDSTDTRDITEHV
jgi:hypothetical protein